MLPTVTVVIPAFKSAQWIEKTLESVLAQTYPHERMDILVIDDASPDDGANIAREVLKDASIKSQVITRERNSGVAVVRNFGWRTATGEWVQFLDQDDLLMPHKLELQVARAVSAPSDVAVVYSNWQQLSMRDGHWQPVGDINEPAVDDDPVVRILEDFSFGYVGPTIIRRSFLPLMGGFLEEPNLGEDIDLMLRIAMAGGRFCKAPSTGPAFLYREAPLSLSHTYLRNVEAMRNLLSTFRRAEEHLRKQSPEGGLAEDARQALIRRYSRWPDFYREFDPESFRTLMQWLEQLGTSQPTNLGPKMRMMSKIIGYENAARLRDLIKKRTGRQ
jgi:glycosyltransferase involved in cell wall biosynthesis